MCSRSNEATQPCSLQKSFLYFAPVRGQRFCHRSFGELRFVRMCTRRSGLGDARLADGFLDDGGEQGRSTRHLRIETVERSETRYIAPVTDHRAEVRDQPF